MWSKSKEDLAEVPREESSCLEQNENKRHIPLQTDSECQNKQQNHSNKLKQRGCGIY